METDLKIEHIALWTKNLKTLKSFYMNYFNCSVTNKYINREKQFESYFLQFKEGTRLELMSIPGLSGHSGNKNRQCGLAHFAVSLGSRKAVIDLTERCRADGIPIQSEPRYTGDNYFESIILDPDGNIIELTE
ncbi:MAG: VOC family protein [Spirochaetales bacterium]|nr:VOC family protein [Spirochaetales bacterium]